MKTKSMWGLLLCTFLSTNLFSQVSFTADVTSGCIPLTVNFTNTSTLPASTYYMWNFGGGPSENSINATHTFSWQGNYNINLSAFDTTGGMMNFLGSYSLPGGINANGSGFYYTADTVCPNESIEMYLYPYGNNTSWDFGDGNTSNQQQPQHSYTNTGTYTVTVTANTSCGLQTATHDFVIMNNAVPNAEFNGSPNLCPNDAHTFYPQNYQAASYLWDFGDGNTSTDNQPTHSWATAGNYPVTLTLTSTCGTTDTYTDTINVVNNLNISSYVQLWQSASNVCPGDVINFDYSMDEAYITLWNFGNGDTSVIKNPNYSYAVPGTYNVSLYLENGCGNDTTLLSTVNVVTNLPFTGNAYMNINPNPVCPGDEMNFYSSSAVSYLWDFGDGNFSTTQNNTHVYSAIGDYNVSLTLTNGCGSDTTLTDTAYINNAVIPVLNNSGDNGNWGMPANQFCPGDSAIFYAYGGSSYLWDFGDGDTTTQTTELTITEEFGTMTIDVVYHAYTSPGTYNVVLTMFNSCGNSASDTMTVTIGTGIPAAGGFAINDSAIVACRELDFISYGGGTYEWIFGDGDTTTTSNSGISHTYSASGNYMVTLNVTNGCGNSASYSENIAVSGMIPSVASVTPASCNNSSDGSAEINVSGGTSGYLFSVDGGSQQANGIFSGLTAGNHYVEITDANNCVSSINVLVNAPSAISLTPSSVNSTCGNANGSASVNATGGTAGYTYLWSSGGTAANENNLSAGVYSVTVTDANNCTSSTSVAVNDNGGPVVTYPTTYSAMCLNETAITLTGGTPAGGTYSGNGVSGGIFDPSAAGAGTHSIIYTYTNAGCTSSANQNITVNGLPVVNISSTYDDVCLSASAVTLTGGFPSGGTYSGTGVSSGEFNPLTAGAGSHVITYSYTDANSCTNSATENITVIEVTYPTTYSPVCIDNGTIVLSGGSPAGGNYSGTGITAGAFDPAVAGAGTFTLVYTYSSGACTASASQNITVNALPVVSYATSYPIVCDDDAGFALTGATPAGGTYSGTGVSAGSFSPVSSGTGTFVITYSYTDGNSCTNSDTATITVDVCAGVNEVSDIHFVSISPNPFSEQAIISLEGINQSALFELFDISGKKIQSFNLLSAKTILERSTLAPGTYIYKVSNDTGINQTGRLIVQ